MYLFIIERIMKTLLLFILLRSGSIDIATDRYFLPDQKIQVVETILSDYYGTAFIDFNGWVYEIYCTEEGYVYNEETFLTIQNLLIHEQLSIRSTIDL